MPPRMIGVRIDVSLAPKVNAFDHSSSMTSNRLSGMPGSSAWASRMAQTKPSPLPNPSCCTLSSQVESASPMTVLAMAVAVPLREEVAPTRATNMFAPWGLPWS
jgi:hypothetical protein